MLFLFSVVCPRVHLEDEIIKLLNLKMQHYLNTRDKNELKPWHCSHKSQGQVLPAHKLGSWANFFFNFHFLSCKILPWTLMVLQKCLKEVRPKLYEEQTISISSGEALLFTYFISIVPMISPCYVSVTFILIFHDRPSVSIYYGSDSC